MVERVEEVDQYAEGDEVVVEFAVEGQLLVALFGRCGCVPAFVGGFDFAIEAVGIHVVDDMVMFDGNFYLPRLHRGVPLTRQSSWRMARFSSKGALVGTRGISG